MAKAKLAKSKAKAFKAKPAKAAKARKSTGPRPGKGPGGFTVMYGS